VFNWIAGFTLMAMLPNGRASGTSGPSVKIHGLQETVQRLLSLPVELAGKNGGPVRKASFAAAGVIEREAEIRAAKATGRLERNIIKMRDRNPRGKPGRPTELYHVGVRGGGKYGSRLRQRERKKVLGMGGSAREADRAAKALEKDAYYWWFVENGTAKMAARPYLRPAFESKKNEAVMVFSEILKKAIDRLERTVK